MRVEREFLPSSLGDLADLRWELRGLGVSPAETLGLLGWLVGKWASEPDETNTSTRAKYRRHLSVLLEVRRAETRRQYLHDEARAG